jgi:hypothetical protein
MYPVEAVLLTLEQADRRYAGQFPVFYGNTEYLKESQAASACLAVTTAAGERVTLFIFLREELRDELAAYLCSIPSPINVISADLLTNDVFLELRGARKNLYIRADSAGDLWSARADGAQFDVVFICGAAALVTTHTPSEEVARRKRAGLRVCAMVAGENHHPEQLWSKEQLQAAAIEPEDSDSFVLAEPVTLPADLKHRVGG